MRNWPNISDGNSKALLEFSDFLVRCVEAVKSIGSPAELDSTEALIAMTAKLPSYSGVKWCRHAHDMRLRMKKVSFTEFVRFVKEEADLANDFIFSPDALKRERRKTVDKEYKSRSKRSESSSTARGSFATTTTLPSSKPSTSKPTSCPACEKPGHALERCYVFKAKSAEDRRDFVMSKGLCFGCLKSGHLSSSCQGRLQCEECGKPHPMPLYGVKPKPKPRNKQRAGNNNVASNNAIITTPIEEEIASCNCVESSGATTSLIVPIFLSHKDYPDCKVKVYALR
ncbi:uncharacterized protein LOC114574887 [Exaiptasia diaphana]|uniref:CCHC-type domain-containing protein n=1 Tax=Exaiptasia diaphana TaxID=2652724 RepID=A0A913YH52_EXADI|nr:uncharacterized protein LOC114574887 [Exaiptasia diaphana]